MSVLRRILPWRRPDRPTPAESDMLRLVLRGDDPRFAKIALQLDRAPSVVHAYPAQDQFLVFPTSSYDDLSFPLEVGRLESAWLRVVDVASGRGLEFRVAVGRHGFMLGLEGRTVDGEQWPRDWSVDPPSVGPALEPLLVLPSAAEARAWEALTRERLASWLGAGVTVPKRLDLIPPATEAALDARAAALGGTFPTGFRTFLGITDGLATPAHRIHGHQDIYELDPPLPPMILVAWDEDDRDDYVIVISMADDERVQRIDIHDPDARPIVIAPEFASFVRALIAS